MEEQIPTGWLEPVIRFLSDGRVGKDKEIDIPPTTYIRWQSDSFGAWEYELREDLIDALTKPAVMGKYVPDQPEDGVTYAFWFFHKRRQFYGKICLLNNQIQIKVLSAHLPDRGTDRL
jgi:hypothetical protein